MKHKSKRETKMDMTMRETTLFHRRRDGGVKVWMCRQVGNRVSQSWGEHGGKIQTTVHDVKGNDREGPVSRAAHRYDRLIEMRQRKGYVTKLGSVKKDVLVEDSTLDFDRLPRHFAPAKPKRSIDLKLAEQWDKEDKLSVQRKRDGMRHRIVSGGGGRIRIYSSSNADVTEALLPIVGDLKLPPKTMLDVELTATTHDGSDSFKLVSMIARSNAARAHRTIKQAEKDGYDIRFVAFDLLYEEGQSVYTFPYRDRRTRLGSLLGAAYRTKRGGVVTVPEQESLKTAIANVKTLGWEGLVVWRTDQPTVVRTNGSPERTNCFKIKFTQEQDVVATGYKLGKGRNRDVVGKLMISEHRNGKLVPMGRCGTGLDDKTREAALGWKYPCVIQIEYDNKSQKGFRFPVFIRERRDKAVRDAD